jgi:hypothetical protein
MPRLLNPQHEFFARAYVNGPFAGSLVDAYEAAGYSRDTANAARLARQPDVALRITELREGERAVTRHAVRTALDDVGIDRATLVRHYAQMLRANPRDYYTTGDDGSVQPHLDSLDREKGLALRELTIESTPTAGAKPKIKLRIRAHDKLRVMAELRKLIEFSEDMPVLPRPGPFTPEQERERVVANLRDYAERAEDDDVRAIAGEAIAAARARYPDGNLTTFERISRDIAREAKARAEQARAANAAAEATAAKMRAMAALLPAAQDEPLACATHQPEAAAAGRPRTMDDHDDAASVVTLRGSLTPAPQGDGERPCPHDDGSADTDVQNHDRSNGHDIETTSDVSDDDRDNHDRPNGHAVDSADWNDSAGRRLSARAAPLPSAGGPALADRPAHSCGR